MKTGLAVIAFVLGAALGPAHAGGGNEAAIRAIDSLRAVDFLAIVDVAGQTNPDIDSLRAMPTTTPLTRLQLAIAANPALVEAIRNQHWSPFDLKSVYSARVEGGSVYLYMGDPPLN